MKEAELDVMVLSIRNFLEVMPEKPTNTSHRLLLVEDNPGDARLITELLSEPGVPFEVETVDRLDAALERVRTGAFDLVILDLSLPDSQGIDTFHRLSAVAGQLPIIVLSGLDNEAVALQTVREGAQDYLVKGVDQRNLIRSLRYALERAEADRALAEERNLLRSVIDNLFEAIYVKDLQGRYILVNKAHSYFVGAKSPEGVIGKTAFDFFPKWLAEKATADDRYILETGNPIIHSEEQIFTDAVKGRWFSNTKVPLRNRDGNVIGIVGIGRDISDRKQAEEQLFLYNAEIKERNTELEDDLHMAREIQQAFLPQQYPTFPHRATPDQSALHFYSRYIPTTAVGGDFFHVLPISDSQAGIFICDVMGHGVRAALVTAIQRALVEEMLPVAGDPGRFLTEINRALISILRRARTPMFASAFYMVVDVHEGVLRYANAGHPMPLHLHRDLGTIDFLVPVRSGPALGVFADTVYHTTSAPVAPHDLIILFTDGLYEVEGGGDLYFDQSKLLQTISAHLHEPTEDLINGTLSEIQDFAVDHVFEDDVCLVGVEIEHVLAPEPETV